MPRYHFHAADGSRYPDEEGAELADDLAAQCMAVKYMGEMIISEPSAVWTDGEMRVDVTDNDNTPLFAVVVSAVDARKT